MGLFGVLGSFKITQENIFQEQVYYSLSDKYEYKNFYIERALNKKFPADKIFASDEEIFIALDGVVSNFKRLQNIYASRSFFYLLKQLYYLYGGDFVKELRGDFSLVIYDKIINKCFIYTNSTSSKPMYYYIGQDYKSERVIVYASNFKSLYKFLIKKKCKISNNFEALYSLASLDYIIGTQTFLNEVAKIAPGCYLQIDSEMQAKEHQYFKLESSPEWNMSYKKTLEKLNHLFEDAVRLQFEKDLEYNYNHLSTLSGGLDSRMTTLIGKKIGFKQINTLTFSSKGYWDEIIAKSIATKHKLKSIFKNLNDGEYLREYSKIIEINGGMVSYYIAAQMVFFYETIDFEKFGLIHTGQVGDAIVGSSLFELPQHLPHKELSNSHRNSYSDEINRIWSEEEKKHDNAEIALFYNHVFNGTLNGNWLMYPFTESSSPFLNEDFLSFCLKIPLKYRNSHKMYYDWISQYHPEMGVFFYEKTNKRTLPIIKNSYTLNRYVEKILKLNLKRKGLINKNNHLINYSKWFNSNDLGMFFQREFDILVEAISNREFKKFILSQFQSPNIRSKLTAFSALLIYHEYYRINE